MSPGLKRRRSSLLMSSPSPRAERASGVDQIAPRPFDSVRAIDRHLLAALALSLSAAPIGCAHSRERSGRAVDQARAALQSAPQRTGDVRVHCEPPDAEVSLDGVPQGRCDDFGSARGLTVGQGMHRVEVKKQGHLPYQTYVDPSGAKASLSIQLRAEGTTNKEGAAR